MKKSEQYTEAMMAVLAVNHLTNGEKLEIVETLMDDRKSARWFEEQQEKNAAKEGAQ